MKKVALIVTAITLVFFTGCNNENREIERFLNEMNERRKDDSLQAEKLRVDSLINDSLNLIKFKNGEQFLIGLKKNKDDFSQISFYKNIEHDPWSNLMSLYIGEDESEKDRWIRLKISYKSEDWLFFNRIILSYDERILEIPFLRSDKKTDNGFGGKIWEWIDIEPKQSILDYLKDFSMSTDAKIKFSGKTYYDTRKISEKERKLMVEMIEIWENINKY